MVLGFEGLGIKTLGFGVLRFGGKGFRSRASLKCHGSEQDPERMRVLGFRVQG